MSDPSPGLAIGWRIAASEAGAAGYPKIECAHLMMGLLSLDKANPKALKDLGFDPVRMGQVAVMAQPDRIMPSSSVSQPEEDWPTSSESDCRNA